MIFTRTMQLLQKEILATYEVSSTIRHKGEKGRQREEGYAMFLREHLPARYGIASGEVIPSVGDASPQCDVIIYDRMSFPVIGISSTVQQVLLESVYSVTEVKSVVDKAAIADARSKFAALRKLPRCKRNDPPVEGVEYLPFFVLFGYHLHTSTDACLDLVREAPNRDTVVVALDRGIACWAKFPHATGPTFFGSPNGVGAGATHTLCLTLAFHLEWLRQIDLNGRYSPFDLYLNVMDEKTEPEN